jgi:hypothetical protein
MNVLSLFDGMSCGQIALKELRIDPDINLKEVTVEDMLDLL